MFKCENCEGSYAARIASSWDFCPRCMNERKVVVPLTFELGWSPRSERSGTGGPPSAQLGEPVESMASTALD